METNKKIYNAILKLSRDAELSQRASDFARCKKMGINAYSRPMLAGAYHLNGETMICNGFYGAIFNGEIDNLQMVEGKGEYLDLHKILTTDKIKLATKQCEYDIDEMRNLLKLNKNANYTIDKSLYQLKYLLSILDCFDNCKLYCENDNKMSALIFKGTNGIGILLPLRQ